MQITEFVSENIFFPSDNHFVCGTDNQTYPTRCHLLRAQCAGHKVNLKHRGPCKGIFIHLIEHLIGEFSNEISSFFVGFSTSYRIT